MSDEKHYFIQNPAGAIHEVTKAHAAELLKRPGYRPATKEQVKAYKTPNMTRKVRDKDGNIELKKVAVQRFDRPIGEPWMPSPEGFDMDELFADVNDPEPKRNPEPDPEPQDDPGDEYPDDDEPQE